MANQFEVRVPNVLEAFMAGEQGYDKVRGIMKERATGLARQEAMQELQGGNPQNAIARLMGIGDIQGASTIANMGNNQRDFAFRQQEAQRAQQNADRGFGLQERQISTTAGNTAAAQALQRAQFQWQQEQGNRPEIREGKDVNGDPSFFLIDRKNNAAVPVATPGASSQPNNPFMTGGKMNEGQSNAALYASRAMEAEKVLSDPAVSAAGGTATERARANVPFIGNFTASKDFQKFNQARRDFTAAILRKESGAAIGKEEYDNADKQYFPQPGDSAEVIEQKRRNRISAIRGIGAAAGPGYKPSMTIDAQGNVVERAAPGSKNLTGPDKTITGIEVTDLPPLPPGFKVIK